MNVLSVLVLAGYTFYVYAYLIGTGLSGNSTLSGGDSSDNVIHSFWELDNLILPALLIFVLLVIGGLILSHTVKNTQIGLFSAFLPSLIMLIFGAVLYIPYALKQRAYEDSVKSSQASREAEVKKILSAISRDYSDSDGSSFLTIDKTNNVIVYLRVNGYPDDPDYKVQVLPVGKIKGDILEVYSEEYITGLLNNILGGTNRHGETDANGRDYKDMNGKTIYDTYKVIYKGKQNIDEYHLDKYIDPALNEVNV